VLFTGIALHRIQYVVFVAGVIEVAIICVPPVGFGVLNHPTGSNPARVGFCGKVPIATPGCLDSGGGVGVPPFALNVNVTLGIALHRIQYVVFVAGVIEVAVISIPPVGFGVLNHPTGSNPARVGFCGKVPIAKPGCLTSGCVAGVPPFALNVKVTPDIAVHLA